MKSAVKWMMVVAVGVSATMLAGCSSSCCKNSKDMSKCCSGQQAGKASFGTTSDGKAVEIYTLKNSKGAEAKITTYGGILTSLKVPDRSGKLDDVVLGYDTLEGYLINKGNPYFGALIGRYGNRIGGAKFSLDGKTCTLPANNGPNTLHGGTKGFDKVVWDARLISGSKLELTYLSKDGEQGFPGNLKVTAVYTLDDDNAIHVDFTATTDKPTVCNLTQHSYFNLRGQGNGDILSHELCIYSDKTTPVDKELITTGEFASVEGTPFDFRKPTAIGARIDNPDTVLQFGPGYDHNWVINQAKPGELTLQASVFEPTSGRVLEVLSTEPGLQFYAGNFLDGTITGKAGKVYPRRSGLCLEPQHYPDSPNKSQFPSTTLRPGQVYHNTIIYKFGVK